MQNNIAGPGSDASRLRLADGRRALVIGCGVAGPVAALALRRAGWSPEIHEANPVPADEAGVFLNVVANGMSALKTIGVRDRVAALGFAFAGIAFHDERGRDIGVIDYGDQERDFGAGGIIIKRGLLQRGLREAALAAKIPIAFGKNLTGIEARADGVAARFADGTTAEGEVLIGCDGINSATRKAAFPEAPKPSFTNLHGYGGFAKDAGLPQRERLMHMHFGRRAFFGYATAPDGEVFWFGNVDGIEGDGRLDHDAVRARVAALHSGDPEPVPGIVAATVGDIGWYPIYDMPSLPAWHADRVVLVGDAAHAMSPHVGQGASLAMEDAVVLAKCLRDIPETEAAFRRYHALRHQRVERIGRAARRSGDRKVPGPVMRVVRNLLLPLFLKLGEKGSREAYAYRIDWDEPVAPAERLRRAA